MPAYFTLMMEFSRYEVDLDTVEKLDKAFEIVGLKFKSGFWGKAEDRTKEEIILHNQTLLEEDFMLGAAQNHDEGYWQSEYEYEGFSSVRGMFLNNAPEKGEFEYVLLIPEEEVLGGDGKTYRADPIEKLGALAEKLWAIPQIRSIQTGAEGSDDMTPESEYREGKPMQTDPFAVISERYYPEQDTKLYDAKHIQLGGVMITSKKAKIEETNG